MKKQIICCDMDNTIEDLLTPWVQMLNKRHNLDVRVSDIKDWEMEKTFTTLEPKQIYEPLNTEELWKNVHPIEGAVEYLEKLDQEGFNIYIVTSADYRTVKYKLEHVLFKYFPFIKKQNVIIAHNKQMIKCDIMIDDGPHNIIGDYKGILVDTEYNRNFHEELYPEIYREKTWQDIYNRVHFIEFQTF